ncbi:LOW QUALITY PROTEIN: synaptogyrin-3 [Myotis lucifugus]|uniref:LOW QUALITY PROTEIN: synaptogyrin-3 n=1 Tax=Myotis lucifugus TaxID=59463 RepID=UPI000CCC579D|nr:LOW QUALITY PROTEIN: synaptogyrin-3 [Myotis lucifugus]
MEGASFGAGLAGAAVDPVSFAKRPQTLLRVVSWVSGRCPGGAHLKALHRFRLGTTMSIFATEQLGTGAGQGLPWLPSGAAGVEGPETYQSPPFTETLDTSPKGYQVPAY